MCNRRATQPALERHKKAVKNLHLSLAQSCFVQQSSQPETVMTFVLNACYCRHMRWPQQISFPALFPLVVLTASAPIILAEPAAAVANLSADAQTLLQEQAWAEAFQWNSSTSMCHQWFGVECDDSKSHVLVL